MGYELDDGRKLETPAALIKLSVTRLWQREVSQLRRRRSRSIDVLVGVGSDFSGGLFAVRAEKELIEKERGTAEAEAVMEAFDALPHDFWVGVKQEVKFKSKLGSWVVRNLREAVDAPPTVRSDHDIPFELR